MHYYVACVIKMENTKTLFGSHFLCVCVFIQTRIMTGHALLLLNRFKSYLSVNCDHLLYLIKIKTKCYFNTHEKFL